MGDSFHCFSGSFSRDVEAAQLLLARHREPELEEPDAGAHEHAFKIGALAHEFEIVVGRAEAHHALDAGAIVPGAVEEHDFAAGRQVLDIALEIPLVRSRSVGFSSATTRAPRGFRCSMKRLMVPPLPAASRPSKMTMMRSPVSFTQFWTLSSSTWSWPSAPRRPWCRCGSCRETRPTRRHGGWLPDYGGAGWASGVGGLTVSATGRAGWVLRWRALRRASDTASAGDWWCRSWCVPPVCESSRVSLARRPCP